MDGRIEGLNLNPVFCGSKKQFQNCDSRVTNLVTGIANYVVGESDTKNSASRAPCLATPKVETQTRSESMLVLSRKKSESIVIDGQIKIEVLKIKGSTIRLGITAPRDVKILRGELAPFGIAGVEENSITSADNSTIEVTFEQEFQIAQAS